MSFRSDERGQTLVFAAATLFAVATFVGLVYNVGEVTAGRVDIQHAGDAAAYSGALVQADICSAIAWLNEGMGYVYYNASRYAVDTAVLGTLSELKDLGAPDSVVGVGSVTTKYNNAHAKAKEWIPRCEGWLKQMSDMQDAIAIAAPALVKKEIWRVATENGAEKVAMFPDLQYFPDPDTYQEIEIEDLGGGDWRLTVVDGPYAGWVLTIENLGPSHWRITCTDGMSSSWVEVQELGDEFYKVTSSDGNWFTLKKTGDDRVDIVTSQDYTVSSLLTEKGWITSGDTGSESVRTTPLGDGQYRIDSTKGTVFIRPSEDGRGYEQSKDGATWAEVPAPENVTVDGRDFPVSMTNHIKIGQGSGAIHVWVPGRIVVGDMVYDLPRTVRVGPASITLLEDSIRLTANFGPAQVSIADGSFGIGHNWFILRKDAHDDSIWRSVPRGTWRQRLSIPQGDRWTYQYVKESAYFARDSGTRFGETHAVRDHDPHTQATGDMPPWTEWFDMKIGTPVSGVDYHQTRTCWHPSDLSCPLHPGGCDTTGPDGFWHQNPNDATQRTQCPLCRAQNFDDDPDTEVRVYLEDAFDRQGEAGLDREDYITVDRNAFRKPLVLSESLFKFGVNVAVWKEKEELPFSFGLRGSRTIWSDRDDKQGSDAPRWGYVAFASAKSGFWDVTGGEYKYQFASAAERQDWLDGFANLYEPSWQARLWPMRKAILDEDIDVVQDPETGEIVQFGSNYLFYRLKQSYWFKTYEEAVGGPRGDRRRGDLGAMPGDLGRITSPRDWGGGNLNLESGRTLDEVVRH